LRLLLNGGAFAPRLCHLSFEMVAFPTTREVMPTPSELRILRFGVFEFEADTGDLWKAGHRVRLQEQPRQVLRMLLARPGELVTREEVRAALWPADTFVDFDAGLNVVVNRIRHVLQDSASSPRYIETLPRRGYRFIAPVESVAPHSETREPQAETFRDEIVSMDRNGVSAERPSLPSTQGVNSPVRIAASGKGRPLVRTLMSAAAATMLLAAATAAAWWAWQARRPRAHIPAESTGRTNYPYTRLTFGPGLQTDPAFSPDGKFIAYASDRAGNFDIWVQALSGGSEPVQVTKSPAQDTQPAWSPDGATLVFRSERDGGGLFLVPAFGGAERRLTSSGSQPTWSADGSEILFFVGRLPLHRLLGNYLRLHTVSLDGEPPREIVADFLRDGSWRWVAGHPDGRISALGMRRTREFGFFTVSRHEGHVTISKTVPLGADPGALPFRFQWNADGTVLYLEADAKGTRSLWRVRVDPTTLEWRSAERLTTPAGQDVAATLSRDETRLAFSQQQETSRIWVFPIDTMSRPRVVGEGRPLTEEGAKAASAALSPDGLKLAYELWRPGTDRSELWVQDLDDGTRELLATNAKAPVWSRDGTRVAYQYVRLDKQPLEVATAYRPLGGVERFLKPWSSEVMFAPVAWTPDNSLLGTFMSPIRPGGGPTSIVVWPGSNAKAVRPERTLMSSPDDAQLWAQGLSPNARWLLFTVLRFHPTSIEPMVVPADGAPPSAWVRIAPHHDSPDKPWWSADGKTIFFVSKGATTHLNLWAVRFDPERGQPVGEPFALTQFDSPTTVISPYLDGSHLSTSARHAALTMLTVTGSIWMLENVDH
jgi:Tol biopolymer transport system component/DNA-binding winged helix-turn-helix (wHTH) protein